MKRFLAFFGNIYYPSGGMGDFVGDYDDYGDAIDAIDNKCEKDMVFDSLKEEWEYRFAHIYDSETKEMVLSRYGE